MVYGKNKQNNNAQQQNNGQQQIKDPNAPAQKVVEAAMQNYAIQHGGQLPQTNFVGAKQTVGWTPDGKPIESGGNAQPMAQPMDFFGKGGGIQGKYDQKPPVASQPQQQGGKQEPYMGDMADKTPQAQTNFEGFQAPQFKPEVQPQQQGDLSSLSQALANAGGNPRQAQFQADPSQRDGGFFSWLGGLIPKKRPGLREGETPDEYDARMTRNTKMYFTLADALRHLGNIVNTSKYAPLQQFNDPNAMIEQQYQQRRAERQKQAAMDAETAQKTADLALKKTQIDSQKAYKEYLQQMGTDKFDWQKDKDKRDYNYKVGQDEIQNQIKIWDNELKEKNFNEKQRHDIIMEAIGKLRASKSGSGGGRGGSGATPKYTTYDAEGKPHYAWNQTMYEANEAYYNGNTSGKSSTSNSKEVINKDGSSTRVTNRQGGSSVAQKAGMQRRQREEAAKQKGKGASSATKGKGKLGGKKYH